MIKNKLLRKLSTAMKKRKRHIPGIEPATPEEDIASSEPKEFESEIKREKTERELFKKY
jgi:hypothetical protein